MICDTPRFVHACMVLYLFWMVFEDSTVFLLTSNMPRENASASYMPARSFLPSICKTPSMQLLPVSFYFQSTNLSSTVPRPTSCSVRSSVYSPELNSTNLIFGDLPNFHSCLHSAPGAHTPPSQTSHCPLPAFLHWQIDVTIMT